MLVVLIRFVLRQNLGFQKRPGKTMMLEAGPTYYNSEFTPRKRDLWGKQDYDHTNLMRPHLLGRLGAVLLKPSARLRETSSQRQLD